jgi:hypothetical protein
MGISRKAKGALLALAFSASVIGCASLQKNLDNTQAGLNAACADVTATSSDDELTKTACRTGLNAVLAGQESVAKNPTQARVDLNNAIRALGALKKGK